MKMNIEKNRGFFSPLLFPKSRRGDIATLILVIGVFLVCAVMIFSFTFFNSGNKEKFANALEIMAKANLVGEQLKFYENAGENPMDFLNITKTGSDYYVIINEIEDEERVFGVQYRINPKTQAQQPTQ